VDDRRPALRHTIPFVVTPRRYGGLMVFGIVLGLALGLVVGVVLHLVRSTRTATAARLAQGRLADAQAMASEQAVRLNELTDAAAAAETARAVLANELDILRRSDAETAARAEEERSRLSGEFARLSAEALAKNNEQFLTLADARLKEARTAAQGDLAQRQQAIAQLLDPLSETLARYERSVQDMELERKGAYEVLTERVTQLHLGHEQLQKETRNLVTALRSPQTRGRWGEMTLRRAVEAAGMLEHCDFEEQVSTATDDGIVRPDMVVHLPGGGKVVVDSKVPLHAFLAFIEADDDATRAAQLERHARQLRTHIDQLAKKEYWKQFEGSPHFVVAFIPGEPLLAAACEADSDLQDHALAKGVVLATPNTLFAHLRTIAISWQQETLAENAREVRSLGAELYDRLRTMTGHMQSLQKSLGSTVEAYNRVVGSLESRVLVSARKFPSLGVVGSESDIDELSPIDTAPRHLQVLAPEDESDGTQPTILALPEGGASNGTPA
jgi:DNA recombination protein RmuC